MKSSKEIADEIIQKFDPRSSKKITEIITEILIKDKINKYEATIQADHLSLSVLETLENIREEELPFSFGTNDRKRLVGKERPKKADHPDTIEVRQVWSSSKEILKAIYERDRLV